MSSLMLSENRVNRSQRTNLSTFSSVCSYLRGIPPYEVNASQGQENICHAYVGFISRLIIPKCDGYADVYNKIDAISLEQMDKLAHQPKTVVISCEMDLKSVFSLRFLQGAYSTIHSLDYLIDRIWEELALVKIYTKKRGAHPDLSDPICLRKGATIEVLNRTLIFTFDLILF